MNQDIVELFEHTLTSSCLNTILVGFPLVELAGSEFAQEYVLRREAAGIHLRSLRLGEDNGEPLVRHLKEIRYRSNVSSSYSYVFWDGGVAVVDDLGGVKYIEHEGVQEALRQWFELLWN